MKIPAGTYLAVEGAIGSGKTSLARILAAELDARLVLEEAEPNPFLKDFYRDPVRYGLQTQLTFLLSRHRQQKDIQQVNLFQGVTVSDYIFEKDRIFAQLNLQDRELELYNRIADFLDSDKASPDLVVYLQSSPERLLTNIRVRDVEYERALTLEYLQNLCEAYHQFFFHWDKSPLLILNTTRLDFVNNPEHRRTLLEAIGRMPPGITFINDEGS